MNRLRKSAESFLGKNFSSWTLISLDSASLTYYAADSCDWLLRIIDRSFFSSSILKAHTADNLKALGRYPGVMALENIETAKDFILFRYRYLKDQLLLSRVISAFNTLPYEVSAAVFIQLLISLDALNSHNCNHSILTPDNILIDDGLVRVMDYGLINGLIMPADIRKAFKGNVRFIPEKVLQGENADASTDMQNALNILLYMIKDAKYQYLSYDEIPDILNLNITSPENRHSLSLRVLLAKIPEFDRDCHSLIKAFLDSGVLLNSGNFRGSRVLSTIIERTRFLLLSNEYYRRNQYIE